MDEIVQCLSDMRDLGALKLPIQIFHFVNVLLIEINSLPM